MLRGLLNYIKECSLEWDYQRKRTLKLQKVRNRNGMKKGIGKVSIFMIAAAIGLSVAACTPQDEKGGRKTQTETTVQLKMSFRNG